MCRNATVLKAELVVMHAKIRRVNLQEHKNYQKKIQNLFQNIFLAKVTLPQFPNNS